MSRTPCSNCPWRRDVEPGTWPNERFQNLYVTRQDDGFSTMACHHSTADEQFACAGFVVQIRFNSIGVRMQAFTGKLDVDEFDAGGLELYNDFDEMLVANGTPIPRRNVLRL